MAPSRLVYHVYHTSRSRYDANHNNSSNHSTNRWCYNIHALLKDIGMEDAWNKNELDPSEAKEWRSTVKDKAKTGRSTVESKNATQTKTAHIPTAENAIEI